VQGTGWAELAHKQYLPQKQRSLIAEEALPRCGLRSSVSTRASKKTPEVGICFFYLTDPELAECVLDHGSSAA
jgi:hypothetical protein